MTDNIQELSEILTKLENAVALNIGSQGMRGEAPKRSHWKAKQALLDWHNKQVEAIVGEDEKPAHEASPLEKALWSDNKRIDYRNQLRAEQRNKLKESK